MLRGKRKMRLSRAALETMAIIAYKQPVTKSEVEAIRGVDASGVLATLLERNLVTIKGRSTVVGRPLLYGSTDEFLNYFGLRDLSELPRPEELRALVAAREPEQLEMMELDPTTGMPLALEAGGGLAAETLALGEPDAVAMTAGDSESGASESAIAADFDEDGDAADERFSIADADAAIAAANAVRGEAVLAMATDFTSSGSDGFSAAGGDVDDEEADEDAEDDKGELDDDEFDDDEDDEFDDSYEDDDEDDDEDGDGDGDDEDDQPSARLGKHETEGV
jgi:segregation and condensation protein B